MELSPGDEGRLDTARAEFSADGIYLDTATLGVPPRRTVEALEADLMAWRNGAVDAVAYDMPIAAARKTFASLVGVEPDLVAIGSQVSIFVGLVAASLPDGAEVLTAIGDFTSILFPFHVQAGRGVKVREVPLEQIAESVTRETALVSVSAVQSADGRVADLDALTSACTATGTKILLDTTQAIGWLPVDASRFAFTVCGSYKWLLSPRGTTFFTVQRDFLNEVVPNAAGWYAGADRWSSIYGSPLRLATDARRFDTSPAWQAWVGTASSLQFISEVGVATLHANAVSLANRFRRGLGLPESNSAIVSTLADEEVPRLMKDTKISGVGRAGRLRLGFHVCNSIEDVDRALDVLSGHLRL